jgi:hypothetical protein
MTAAVSRRRGRWVAGLRSAVSWLVDWSVDHAASLVIAAGTVGMTVLAKLTKWIGEWGLLGLGGIAVLSLLVLSLSYWLVSQARRLSVQRRMAERHFDADSVNPLADHFSRRRINLVDFAHPFYQATEAAKFHDCELVGPAAVVLEGSSLVHSQLQNCDAVIVRKDTPLNGVMLFRNCIFDRCKFYRVTFAMSKEAYQHLKALGLAIPVVSDTDAGDV